MSVQCIKFEQYEHSQVGPFPSAEQQRSEALLVKPQPAGSAETKACATQGTMSQISHPARAHVVAYRSGPALTGYRTSYMPSALGSATIKIMKGSSITAVMPMKSKTEEGGASARRR